MRVLLVANTAASMVWFRLPLLRALRAAGHQVWVMAPDGWGVDRILAESVSFLPLPHRQGFSVDAHGEGRHSYLDALADLDTDRDARVSHSPRERPMFGVHLFDLAADPSQLPLRLEDVGEGPGALVESHDAMVASKLGDQRVE